MKFDHILVLSTDPGVPLYGPSGASAHLRGMSRALRLVAGLAAAPSAGGSWGGGQAPTVVVAVPRLSDHRGKVDDPLPFAITTCLPRSRWWLPRSYRERGELWDARRLVKKAVARHGVPEVIWERHALFSDAGMQLQQRRQVPRIVELNAPLALERARYGRLHDRRFAEGVERASLRAADRVIAVSAWLARWAVEEAGCNPERVLHVPNGVEDRRKGDRDGVRGRLGLSGLVIGFVGSLKPWHGVDRLPGILEALPGATALVVGDGPTKVPEHPRIRAVGRIPPAQVGDYVSAMDVGLAPYPADAPPWFCPLKILEYQAQGVPVVASDLGECPSLVERAPGEVVAPDDPVAWADAIRRQAGNERVRRVRSWRQVVMEATRDLAS